MLVYNKHILFNMHGVNIKDDGLYMFLMGLF